MGMRGPPCKLYSTRATWEKRSVHYMFYHLKLAYGYATSHEVSLFYPAKSLNCVIGRDIPCNTGTLELEDDARANAVQSQAG